MRLLIATSLLAFAPLAAQAQTPSLPSSPSLSLPIEVVKANPYAPGGMYYERAGLKPREFRVSASPSMAGATWSSFKEGVTTNKLVNGKTVVTGRVNSNGVALGTSCGTGSVWAKGYLQFRATDPAGKVYVSNIKGDSACVMLGG